MAIADITKLTANFSLNEALRSTKATQLGIPNTPSVEELATIHRTAIKMEEVRKILGAPIIVSSWFRNDKVNKAVGGVPNSQHRTGEAVDFSCKGMSPYKICQKLLEYKGELRYDQLILEPSWVHISFNTSHAKRNTAPRMQYLDLSK